MDAETHVPLRRLVVPGWTVDDTFRRDLVGLYRDCEPTPASNPSLVVFNAPLAAELGLDPQWPASADGVAVLSASALIDGSDPLAQVYAGHQFGNYSPRLGDGRALLVAEVVDVDGRRRDLHLKGSGRTPFSRGGDGRAALGPMLREYVVGEAMHALGIPTTRALAVVATGDTVWREPPQPGAVLARIAASHLRVGTFQYAASTGDADLLGGLTDYAIARHHPAAAAAERPALAMLDAVVSAQATLVAQWMLVGFIHGVMNTDNTTISGETIDYGPCAFMDAYDPATVFSSIDHAGRYAYGNQPAIMQWNLARLAEALLPLIDTDTDLAVFLATEVLGRFVDRFGAVWSSGLRAKIGLADDDSAEAVAVASALVETMRSHRLDHTGTFRSLSGLLRGVPAPDALAEWVPSWSALLPPDDGARAEIASRLDSINPVYIARNHLLDDALTAATEGDMTLVDELVDVLADPFTARPGGERFAEPASERFAATFRTFCGT